MMEKTQISRAPESGGDNDKDARFFQGAPTLMGGAEPGSQGTVRIWRPNVWVLRGYLIMSAGTVFYAIGSILRFQAEFSLPFGIGPSFHSEVYILIAVLVLFGGFNVRSCSRRLRRPKCVTTDDAGIAFITRKGNTALLWTQIQECSLRGCSLTLKTDSSRLVVPMPGYFHWVCKALFATVAQHADLYSEDSRRCVRSECLTGSKRVRPEIVDSTPRDRRDGFIAFTALACMAAVMTALPLVLAGFFYNLGREVRAETFASLNPTLYRTTGVDKTLSTLTSKLDGATGPYHPSTMHRVHIDIFVAQTERDGLASPDVPGLRWGSRCVGSAALTQRDAHSLVDEYILFGVSKSGPLPSRLMVRLDYPGRTRWIEARLSTRPLRSGPGDIPLYSNNWGDRPAPGLDQGPLIPRLPSPRLWTFAALSVPRTTLHPRVRDFYFEPTPIRQHTALGTRRPTTAATWLPGAVHSGGVWCTVRYQDGSSQRIHVDTGPAPAGVWLQWGLARQEKEKLPAGSV